MWVGKPCDSCRESRRQIKLLINRPNLYIDLIMCLWLSVQICSVCNAFAAKAPNMLAQRADLIMSVFLKLVIREEMLVYQALQKHIWALWALYILGTTIFSHDLLKKHAEN